MATAKKTAPAKTSKKTEDTGEDSQATTGTNLIDWEVQMAADAALSQKMEESTATGAFFSTKSGQLSWNDSPIQNNQMACIIVDAILENVTHDGEYDSDNPSGPRCFAFARVEGDLKPHEVVFAKNQQVHDQCDGCERNKYGSADKGRGKACKNIRRLAVIPAGLVDGNGKFTPPKADELVDGTMGFLKINVMSVAGYSAYIKQTTAALKRPGYGVFTKVKVVPDAKSQFRILFEPLGLVPNAMMPTVMKRVEEAKAQIMQPYSLDFDEAPAKAAGKPAARGKAPAGKKPAGRKF